MKDLRFLVLVLLAVFLTSCAAKFMVIEEPKTMPPPRILNEKPNVALVLGGGAFHGIAHLGVLKVFEDAGVPIDLIVGASAGSLVGGIYASKPNADSLLGLITDTKTSNIFDFSLFRSKEGFVEGKKLQKFINENAGVKNIEETKIPFIAMTTDLINGVSVPLEAGPLAPSINASSAIPGIFVPVIMYDIVMVDGGILDNIPVNIAKQKGAEVIFAVNVMAGYGSKDILKNRQTIALRAKMLANQDLTDQRLKMADLVITPDLQDYSIMTSKDNEAIYQAGLKAAKEALPDVLKILKAKGISLKK